jgi:hypothetical protein
MPINSPQSPASAVLAGPIHGVRSPSQSLLPIQGIAGPQFFGGSQQVVRDQRYFELCVNYGKHRRKLGEIDIKDIRSDGEFFRLIRNTYVRMRGPKLSLFLEPKGIRYIRVSRWVSLSKRAGPQLTIIPVFSPRSREYRGYFFGF